MRFSGFIGPSYKLDSVNVDAQRAVNLYPELIESGRGKEGQRYYYKSTPGLELFQTVGDGPIRLVHVDSIGRILVVSGNDLYRISKRSEWKFDIGHDGNTGNISIDQSTDVDTTDDFFSATYAMPTGTEVTVESTGTLPGGLSVSTNYYVFPNVYGSSFKLASSLENAQDGVAIDITSTGSGTMTLSLTSPISRLYLQNISVDDDIDYDDNEITIANHQLYTGLAVSIPLTDLTPLPGGLSTLTAYYIIKVDDNTIKLATSSANASAGTAIDLTTVSGSWYVDSYDDLIETSSGPIVARSSELKSSGGSTPSSSTIFTDGLYNYVLWDSSDYSYSLNSRWPLVSSFSDEAFLPPTFESTHIAWIDGYFILNEKDTNKFWVSDLNSINIDALSFSSSEGDPDIIKGLIDNHRQLWVFNEKTIEIYVNTGNADFPFERVQGGYIEIGCLAGYSIAKINGTILWLGQSESGRGIVYAASGSQPQRVSTHAIEQAIAGYASPEDATAYTYEMDGHFFYVLNFAEATWVYDLATGLWHERAYTNNGSLERHRGECHAYDPATGMHLVGDYVNGKVYEFNKDYYTDNTDAITRLRSAPHLTKGLKRAFCSKFQLDMETGIGLDGGVQGSNPTVMLDFSDDGGHTWSSESWALADAGGGSIGDYKKRVIWRRLGKFRDRIFRVQITDPVKVVLIGAELEFTERGAG